MMIKNLCIAIVLCFFGTSLFAQTEINLPLLLAVDNVYYVPFVQSVSACHCSKINSIPKKQELVFYLDVPATPFQETVRADRIKNQTVQFGGSAMPLGSTVKSVGWPLPRVGVAAADFRMLAEGGVAKILDGNLSRTMMQSQFVLEGSVWYVLVGIDGFFGLEQIPRITKGINFEADFRRRSGGGQGWLGIKFGDFNRSFVAGRYGRGYIYTDGANRFNVPGVDGLDWLPLYLEEFKTESFSVEGKVKSKWISQSVRVDNVEYKRVVLSPDPLRFGENYLQDMWLRTETGIMPLSHLGVVVVLTKDFRDQNRLMFVNDYSSVRVFIRLEF